MGISIIFPHLIGEEQNKVLELNLKMIKENTVGEYEILYLGTTNRKDLVYEGFNLLASKAKYDKVLFTNTDVLLSKGWDESINKCNADWISLRVVECGAIPSAEPMISRDFGRTANSFRRDDFEWFIKEEKQKLPEYEDGFVWYCPSVLNKDKFLSLGGFETHPPFPQATHDISFKIKCQNVGWTFNIANYSWSYHVQRARINSGDLPERI